jgi:hypothetical protein
MRQRLTAIRCLERLAAAFVMANVFTLCGCIACPEGASCSSCAGALPHDLSLSIPWIGGEDSRAECGSPCERADGEHTTCDQLVAEEDAADHAIHESLYAQVVDRLFIETASTVLFSTASIAGTAFGTIANYCLPEAALGPPDMVPPGRFHPVPTRPVFAHRG